jgi:hypothetical protein
MIAALALVASVLLQTTMAPLRSLDRGALSDIVSERQVSVRDATEWASMWRQHAPGRAQPSVDFGREMVVGVFLGRRPTAGFSVEVTGYRESGADVVVMYRETAPSRDLITAQMLTAPYDLVAIPRHTGAVTFEKLKP